MIEIIVSAFNCSDVRLLHGLLSEATIDNVQLTSSTLGCELFGLNPLMVYFGLLLECYPDGTCRYVHTCASMYVSMYVCVCIYDLCIKLFIILHYIHKSYTYTRINTYMHHMHMCTYISPSFELTFTHTISSRP